MLLYLVFDEASLVFVDELPDDAASLKAKDPKHQKVANCCHFWNKEISPWLILRFQALRRQVAIVKYRCNKHDGVFCPVESFQLNFDLK